MINRASLSTLNKINQSIQVFDRLESKALPAKFDSTHSLIWEAMVHLTQAKGIKRQIKASPFKKYASVSEQLAKLTQRIIGLQARLQGLNGREKIDLHQISDELFIPLLENAYDWKIGSPLNSGRTFTARDLDVIETACRYPKFAHQLLRDTNLRESFFKWAMHEGNNVDIFIQYPSTAARLTACMISNKIGRLGGQHLAITEQDGKQVVTLPFLTDRKVEHISILDESKKVRMNLGWEVKIRKIFEVFANKNDRVGDFEFLGEGILNWNVHKLGSWDPQKGTYTCIDLEKPNWWEQLPIFEVLSKEAVCQRYEVELKEGEWVAGPRASRETATFDIDKTHGYLEFAMPRPDGTYGIYYMGKFAELFPIETLEILAFIGNTVPAKISYPDDNAFYSNRQQVMVPYVLTPEQGQKFIEIIRCDLEQARIGNMVFQFAWESCAHWPQSVLDRTMGYELANFYRMPLFQATPSNPFMGTAFSFMRNAPEFLQPALFRGLELMLSTGRGREVVVDGKKVHRSLLDTPFSKQRLLHHPAYLHWQVEQGLLKGKISYGNT